jgi:dTDP-4-dehydrorhamnose 3,5-epimerase
MFQEGPIEGVKIKRLARIDDARGWLVELFRHDEMDPAEFPAMAYLSQTLAGATRGPHKHREQTDCFAFVGPGDFRLYLWDDRREQPTYRHRQTLLVGQSNPVAVVIPPGVVHGYKNVGQCPGLVFNCPNRLYAGQQKGLPVDEVRFENRPDSLFELD